MITTPFHYIQQALFNLMATKLRSTLAALGILVGTAAIVALISCSQLATEKALAQFKSLGTDLISLSIFQQTNTNSNDGNGEITLQIWRELPKLIPDALGIAPYTIIYQTISFKGFVLNASVIGADESLGKIINIQLESGHFISFFASFERYCVIGYTLAQELKKINIDDPLGKQLKIGQTLYTIIGVAAPWKENSFFNENINQSIIIPIAGTALLDKNSKINNAILRLKSDDHIDASIEQIKDAVHTKAPDSSVFLRSAKQIIDNMESQGQIFTLLLSVIGGIALLVGGIGVMNVMLIAVSERKKEIGIRKAIGAKNYEIQALFLAESILLSLFGGTLGLIIGLLFTWIIAYFSHWPFIIYKMPIFIGFTVSVSSGIFFGFYPARRAAMLTPIESLRNT